MKPPIANYYFGRTSKSVIRSRMKNPKQSGSEVSADTLEAVARAAGVSRMTVSRALRGAPHVSEKTKQKVLAAKEAVGYSPNPLISTLMSQVRRGQVARDNELVAFVTAYERRDGWKSYPSIVRMRKGVEQRAGELGFRIEDFWAAEPGLKHRRLSRILFTRSIRAVLVAPVAAQDFHLDFDWRYFAAATFEFSLAEPRLHRVTSDRFASMRIAIREARSRGYARPGLALRKIEDDRNNDFWSAAFLLEDCQRKPKGTVPPLLMANYDEKLFHRWLARHRPDCVLGINSIILDWIKNAGLSVPEEIGFIHLNLMPDLFGKVSGIDGAIEELGRSAMDIVVGQMHRNEWGVPATPRLVITPGRWVEGATL
jgi:DNA-binding LacI/PurR family transcriptional regulator